VTTGLRVGNAQIIGSRTEQQDAFGFTDKDDESFVRHGGVAAVVADGMGGHAHGGDASRIAVRAFLHCYMSKPEHLSIPDALRQAFDAANRAVCAFAEEAGETGNCGATLIAAAVHPASHSLHWIGTGDSRIFLFRRPQWVQVTTDSNYGNQLLNGQIQGIPLDFLWENERQLQGLTSFLGLADIGEIDCSIRGFRLHPKDWLVLCSDGVYDTLTKDEMVDCLSGDPNLACEDIIREVSAKNLNHQDNASLTIIACDFGAAPALTETRGSQRRAFIVKMGLVVLFIIAIAGTFSVGLYAGQGCIPDSQFGFWGQIRSTLICLKAKFELK